ncbi:MAG: Uma2 family endonuclease [Verrucomicrobiota bacterium]|jgi:Uma2 family endonuclease
MATLAYHRFTSRDYYRMAETGVLKPDARVELLDGQVFEMSPIGPFHGGAVSRLNRLFVTLSKGRWFVWVQNPVTLDDYSEPQPDLMLLKPAADDYTTALPAPDDVFLLIEVSDSTVASDREKKLPLYGRAGIREVWIVNLPDQSIEVCRDPHYQGYASTEILRPGSQARPLAFPDVAVDLADLLRHGPA